jgi:putative membrane protein
LLKQKKFSNSLIFWLILTYFSTFLIEAIGTNTGLIFGNYIYGDIFKLKLFETPILIGLNWIVVCLGSLAIATKLQLYLFKKPAFSIYQNTFLTLSTASIATIFDFFLEPVAIRYGYWNWQNSIIPVSNYIWWFIISGFFSLIFILLKIKINLYPALVWFLIQFSFMVVMYVFTLGF